MSDRKVRRDVARTAARLMYERTEREYFTAKRKAAKMLGLAHRGHFRDLPSNAEIRDEIQTLARMHEGDSRAANLLAMRIEALRTLRDLTEFQPRLIGSVLTGHIRAGSDIDIHCFADSPAAISARLDDLGLDHQVEHKRVLKHGLGRTFTHVHVTSAQFPIELTVYPRDKVSYVFRSSITGGPIERANAATLEELIRREHPEVDLDGALTELDSLDDDRFEVYRSLLLALDRVTQGRTHHPERNALYHALQVFELAREARPYDEEFLLAALLHDVGKGVDRSDHVQAGLAALGDTLTPRVRFLIEHHMEAHGIADGSIGHRALRRLRESPDFDDLTLLAQFDRSGRSPRAQTCSLDEALEYIRGVSAERYLQEP